MAEETKRRRGWLTILLSVAALIALGFAVYALVVSSRVSRSDDARRVRDLAIAAANISGWPDSAGQIGKSNLYHRGVEQGGHAVATEARRKVWLHHPDLADFQVEYLLPRAQKEYPDKERCEQKVGIADDKMTVKGTALSSEQSPDENTYRRFRQASWFRPDGGGAEPICFSVENLDLKKVTAVPRGFEHLLLAQVPGPAKAPASSAGAAAPDGPAPAAGKDTAFRSGGGAAVSGAIVAQIGDHHLPIRSLAELPDVEPQLLDMMRAFAQATGNLKGAAEKGDARKVRHDALQPLDSSVAGMGYRFYFYPVTLKGGGDYLLVGTVRDAAEAATMVRLGPRVLAFVLAFLLLAVLTPTIKLALLGPVDGIKPIEAGALVFGLLAAAAFVTAALIATSDVIGVRKAVYERLDRSAAAIRDRTADEIHRVLLGEPGSSMASLSEAMASTSETNCPGTESSNDCKPLIVRPPDRLGGEREFHQPDSLFPIARDGRLPRGMALAVARDLSGAGYQLSDRPYFRRAVNGDFAPGTEQLVSEIREGATTAPLTCLTGGLVFEQVRSRPDGVSKTVAAAPVRQDCAPWSSPSAGVSGDQDEERDRFRVLGVTIVLKSLLSPPLHERERFAVLDAGKGVAGLPVLFHSERGRAGVERFDDALSAGARRGLASAAMTSVACARTPAGPRDRVVTRFSGDYEGVTSLFAATRLPCTDWLIVTFAPRDLVDSYATQAASHAVQFWVGGLILVIAVFAAANAMARAAGGRRTSLWLWLWPDCGKRERYRRAIPLLALVGAFTVLVTFGGELPVLAAIAGPVLAFGVLYAALRGEGGARTYRPWSPRDQSPKPLAWPLAWRPAPPPDRPCAGRTVLDELVERRVGWVIVLLVLSLSVLPMVALARDARGYFTAQQVGDDFVALRESREQEQRAVEAVALTYRKDARAAPAGARRRVSLLCSDGEETGGRRSGPLYTYGERPCFNGTALSSPSSPSLTASMRRATFNMDEHSLYGADRVRRPAWRVSTWFYFTVFALLLGGVLVMAFRSALRGLFGFGVVLEAVAYPRLPARSPAASDIDLGALPSRFIVVAAPDDVRGRLEDLTSDPTSRWVDLFSATEADPPALSAPVREPGGPAPLMIFRNLEMLMRNRGRRLKALAILERAVAEQRRGGGGHGFIIGLISDLSPLDRLLQSYERDAEELERLTTAERHSRRAELSGEREDVRWSRLFESFTTYTYCAAARSRVPDAALQPDEVEAVRVVEDEVAYLPDHVVAAIIPDREAPLRPGEIAEWAKTLKNSAPRAIVDYLSSQLIEHYQLAWSVSSHAERLLLHRFAHGGLVNIGQAYALRSLVRRGLVVLDPVPRLMNRSFGQFIRHAEEPRTLERWRGETQRSAWQALGTPLMIALPFALGVFALIAIRSGESLASLIPFVVSVGPALVNFFNNSRRAAA